MALNVYNIKQITDHVLRAINRLLMMYREPIPTTVDNHMNTILDNEGNPVLDGQIPYISGRVYIFAQYIQREENLKYAMYTQCNLANAAGYTLRRWGAALNVPPAGLTDSQYRAMIYLAITEYASQGTIPNLIQILSQLTGASQIIVQEIFPAKIQLTAIGGSPTVPVSAIEQVIQNTKAGGVGFAVVLSSLNPFVFEYDNSGSGFDGMGNYTPLLNEAGQPILNEQGQDIMVFEPTVDAGIGGNFAGVI